MDAAAFQIQLIFVCSREVAHFNFYNDHGNNRRYLTLGEYQTYFSECVENISDCMSAQHE